MRTIWITAALCLITSSVASTAMAADYYVSSTNGDDTAAGSQGAPWKTIGHAAKKVAPGDVVHVASGHYAEQIKTTVSGTASARVTYRSDAPWGAKIDGGAVDIVWTNNGDYVDIVGFDVTGQGRLGILNLASYVRIMGNHVHDIPAANAGGSGGAAIDNGNYSASDSDIIGNVVHDIGYGMVSNGVHGLYHSNLRGHIYNNISYRNSAWGIHTWHNPKDVIIANNLVFENGKGGIIVGAGDAPGTGVADGFIVENNIVVHNHGNPAILEYGATGPNNTYLNNLFWGNDAGDYKILTGHAPVGTIDMDPMLVDYKGDGTGDYHLLPGSPCIDKGVSANAPADDLDGNPRPYGAGWDIGPYEWTPPPDTGTGGSTSTGGQGGASVTAGSGGSGGTGGTAGGPSVTAGSGGSGGEGGTSGGPTAGATGGCSCQQGPSPAMPPPFALAALLAVLARVATRKSPKRG